MEQATTPQTAPPAKSGERNLKVLLLIAGAGALIILLGLFGTIAAVIGLIAIVVTTVLAAPAGSGQGWWNILASGAVVSVLAALIALGANTLGGLLAVLGGILVLIAVTFGLPYADDGAA